VWCAVKKELTTIETGKHWFKFTTLPDSTYATGTPMDPLGGGMGFAYSGIIIDTAMTLGPTTGGTPFAVPHTGENPTESAKLAPNGHDRLAERDGRRFNFAVPYATHTNVPSTGINVYSFGMHPEEHQPSGSINFSPH
jgi:hypothetical protein